MPYAHSPKSHKWEMAEVGFTLGPSDSNGSLIDFFFFKKPGLEVGSGQVQGDHILESRVRIY